MKLLTFTLGLALASAAIATPIPTIADYSGSRSVGSGITATWGWSGAGNNGFEISWNVTNSGTGSAPWTYTYTLGGSNPDGSSLSKALSHIILQLSENVPNAVYEFPDGADTAGPHTYDPTSNGNSNFGMPGNLYGIKWNCDANCTNPTFTITTSQAPMWGSFYAISGKKPGQEVYAYSNGFGTAPADGTTNFANWIVTPDTRTTVIDTSIGAVPEPGTWTLMAAGIAALVVVRKRKRTGSV